MKQKGSGSRFRFSLRQWFFLLTFVSVCMLLNVSIIRKHNAAKKKFHDIAVFSSGFEDPVGPNWFFDITSSGFASPRKSSWYYDAFCLSGYFSIEFRESSVNRELLAGLRDLYRLSTVTFLDCDLEFGFETELKDCKSLTGIRILECRLSKNSLASLGELSRLEHVDLFLKLDAESWRHVLPSLQKLRSLRLLRVDDSCPTDVIDDIRTHAIDCVVKSNKRSRVNVRTGEGSN